jgi:MFS family permease
MNSPKPRDPSRLTPTQLKALFAAFLGWLFDGLDGYLYVLVAARFVGQLLNKSPKDPETLHTMTIIQCVFLVGWALGGAVFGRIGDRVGRARTLTLTVLTYAVFTGASFFATEWWHLMIFRFIAALGIGGEWAAGSALVAETLHGKHRAWASAFLQSGYMAGCMLASVTTGVMKDLDPKWVFLVGVLPAILTVFIRAAVPEPENWKQEAASREMPKVTSLFAPALARTTILVSAFTSIALVVAWAFLFFVPDLVRGLPEAQGMDEAQIAALKTRVTLVFFSFNIAANFFATYLAKYLGYRRAFFLMLLAAAVAFWFGFRHPPTLANIYWTTSIAVFFGLGFFGMFPLYIPPLFPTLVRTLGAGFTYNIGRLVSAAGVFFIGQLSNTYGPSRAVQWLAFLFIPGMVIALLLPEPPKEREQSIGPPVE